MDSSAPLHRTPFYDLHIRRGGKMVPFAGYEMPVQYATGIIKEHQHTRAAAGLFDIAHMGQILIEGDRVRERVETAVPADLATLGEGRIRYSFLLNDQGGVLDDLMITRFRGAEDQNKLFVVVNASCKAQDLELFRARLPDLKVTMLDDRALLALQGPQAASVLARFAPGVVSLPFMAADWFEIAGIGRCFISRSGYTGEDGFELSVPNATAVAFAEKLLAEPEVLPIGLGARDSLRLEAGLCLYGHELDAAISPVEADIMWAVSKRRRAEGGYVGSAAIQQQLAQGAPCKRVGIRPEGRALAREQTEIQNAAGDKIGIVTSGGFGASADGPVAMGYVDTAHAAVGTALQLIVRGKPVPAKIVSLPFVPHRYHRG